MKVDVFMVFKVDFLLVQVSDRVTEAPGISEGKKDNFFLSFESMSKSNFEAKLGWLDVKSPLHFVPTSPRSRAEHWLVAILKEFCLKIHVFDVNRYGLVLFDSCD
jgi:hypothetical protein